MSEFGKLCIDCGSEVVNAAVEEVKPVFKMEIINYACGATLKMTFSANGNVMRASHSGCTHGQ